MNAMEFRNVFLTLGGRVVLDGVNLNIAPREFGVLGPNGSGKTTLMRAVLGLVPPSRGAIRVLGQPATRGNPAVGYMPQVLGRVAEMRLSGWDFVAAVVNGHHLGLPIARKAGRVEVDRVLDLVGSRGLARRPIAEISGGERQRLLLAQALIGRPRLLLLDEPLISLDPYHQREVVELAQSLQSELGIAVLFSAHELNPLLGALDRVLYLGNGHAALGTVDEVITGPVLSELYGTKSTSCASRTGSSSCPAVTMWNATPISTIMRIRTNPLPASCARAMFEYDFMRNAFAAATVVAIVAGIVGYFLVLRGQTFAGHALAHVGFTGATGAVLVGIAPLWGLVLMTLAAGIGMGSLGERLAQRDVAIGLVLALSLGLGLLFCIFIRPSRRRRRHCCSGTYCPSISVRSGHCSRSVR